MCVRLGLGFPFEQHKSGIDRNGRGAAPKEQEKDSKWKQRTKQITIE